MAPQHQTTREGDEYVCSCGMRWDTREPDPHPKKPVDQNKRRKNMSHMILERNVTWARALELIAQNPGYRIPAYYDLHCEDLRPPGLPNGLYFTGTLDDGHPLIVATDGGDYKRGPGYTADVVLYRRYVGFYSERHAHERGYSVYTVPESYTATKPLRRSVEVTHPVHPVGPRGWVYEVYGRAEDMVPVGEVLKLICRIRWGRK